MLDTNNTSPELGASPVDMAVLPVGAVEQHGPRLPISVDWRTAEVLACGVPERLGAFVLPALPYGNSPAFFDYVPMKQTCPEGIWGVPRLATAEKGRRAVEIMIEETVRHIQETFGRLEQLQLVQADAS